ncbi:MAG: glycosyltransferase [Bacteroidota bacterium]
MGQKKIVVLIDWYLPGYKAGGPIQSVANIVQHLKTDYDIAVITTDTDLHETTSYSAVESNKWTVAPDGTRTYYFSKSALNFGNLKKIILGERADFIYINSLFSVNFTILPLLIRKLFLPNRKVVLAPRGMLGKGALNIKPGKKKIFLSASRLFGLFKNITWHASTILEEEEIKSAFGSNSKVITAVNLTSSRTLQFISKPKEVNQCKLVFISRIASKKNILPVLRALYRLPDSMNVDFDIYGPIDEADYWKQCEAVIQQAPGNIKINYKGPVENAQVHDVLTNYHFSVLYTQHENFGHSIIEGMAAGCPAIISDQTPWRNLAEQNAGWDVPVDNEKALQPVFTEACLMNQNTYDEWSRAALTFASGIINDEKALTANKSLFQ